MASDLAVVPLLSEVGSYARVGPREGVITVPDHLKRLVPLSIARYISMQAHQEREKTLVEQHAVRGDSGSKDSQLR